MTEFDLGKVVGDDGTDGTGITSITKTGTSGLVDTYTITYSDSTTSTFTVTNGDDATVDIVTSFGSTTSDSKVPSEKLVKNSLDAKADTSSVPSDVSDLTDTTGVIPTDVSDLTDTSDTAFTPKSHSHGNITNAGAIGSTSGLPVKTGTDGVLTTGAFGTSAGQFAEGNHTHSGMLTTSDIYDGLDSSATNKALSAKQGKALADLIGDAITYINQ